MFTIVISDYVTFYILRVFFNRRCELWRHFGPHKLYSALSLRLTLYTAILCSIEPSNSTQANMYLLKKTLDDIFVFRYFTDGHYLCLLYSHSSRLKLKW